MTLIELMVVVALLASVMAIGAPSYREFGRSTRVTTQASDLQSALAYARSESLRRGARAVTNRETP